MQQRSRSDAPEDIKFDPVSKNPYFEYTEGDGKRPHGLVPRRDYTLTTSLRAARPYRPAGFAFWRLGSEDPSLWNIFGLGPGQRVARQYAPSSTVTDVDFQGTGEILQVIAQPHDGIRDLMVGGQRDR